MYSKYLFDSYFKGIDTHLNLSIICNNPNSEAVMCLDGYKHSMVQIIALALASKTAVIIDTPPLVIDTHVFVALINELGGKARIINEKLILDMRNICVHTIPYRLGQFIHGSMYLCPALLCALGEFNYYGSGGCRIGNSINSERPIAHIISVMREFGAVITCDQFGHHGLYNNTNNTERVEIDIKRYSTDPYILSGELVGGATKVAILMSLQKDCVVIKNPYIKTDVLDMIRFVRMLGKNVTIENDMIVISGKLHLQTNNTITVSLTECISEIITYSTLAVLQNTKLRFKNLSKQTITKGIQPELSLFRNMGINYQWDNNDLIVFPCKTFVPQHIDVLPNTIQSDHHPFFTLLLSFGVGTSSITEHVWKNRYYYINNLNKMNCSITQKDNSIYINPAAMTQSDDDLPGRDVRCAAVTLLAMIVSNSRSKLTEAEHIFRGYSRLCEHLHELGITVDCFGG